MSTEMMTKDGQFIIIPSAWKVSTWKEPVASSNDSAEPSFIDIMNEQLKEKVEEEEFENYVRQEYDVMSNDFVNLESDQEYSLLLKSCLDQELNLHVLELDDEEEDSDEEVDYQDDSALIEFSYFSKINEHLTKHSHSSSTKCQETKQKQQRVRGRTKSQSQSDIDSDTRMTLYKFMKKSVLKNNYGVVNKGKKSLILHAQGGVKKSEKGESVHLPGECAIKVFKHLPFSDSKQSNNEDSRPASAAVWSHREFQNLKRMEKAGIPCPKAAFVKKAVLVMEFIGKDGKSAWKLRDYPFATQAAINVAYEQVIRNMKIMYKSCHLVHSDLTEKSILFWNNQCYFTDVAHALEAGNNNSHAFLYRNCRNIVDFFEKRGSTGMFTQDSLFAEVAGFEYPGVAVDAKESI